MEASLGTAARNRAGALIDLHSRISTGVVHLSSANEADLAPRQRKRLRNITWIMDDVLYQSLHEIVALGVIRRTEFDGTLSQSAALDCQNTLCRNNSVPNSLINEPFHVSILLTFNSKPGNCHKTEEIASSCTRSAPSGCRISRTRLALEVTMFPCGREVSRISLASLPM